MEVLTDDNYLVFCAKNYDSNCYLTEDFYEDMNRVKYIKKLLTRYTEQGELKERLILNHLIIMNNAFGAEALSKMLFLKLKDQMPYLKPFLILLSILPEVIMNVGEEKTIRTDDIPMDAVIIEKLREL